MTMEEKIRTAITEKRKVNLQMQDTEEDKFILFHPYAIVSDLFNDELSILGLIEKHHTSDEINYYRRPTLKGIKTIELLDDRFEPLENWGERYKNLGLEILESVD